MLCHCRLGGDKVVKFKRPRKHGYSDLLLEPIRVPDPFRSQRHFGFGFIVQNVASRGEPKRIARERKKKLPVLFAHFGIALDDPSMWQKLAQALAVEHVPGFSFVRETGAPVVETVVLLSRLYRYFIREKAKRMNKFHSRRPSNVDFCRAALKDLHFKQCFPELKDASSKRLQNLITKARTLRKNRVKAALQHSAWVISIRRSGGDPDIDDDVIWEGLPDWMPDRPNKRFLQHDD